MQNHDARACSVYLTRRLWPVAFFWLLFCLPAYAEGQCQSQNVPVAPGAHLLCTKAFLVTGNCTGQDELALWHDNSAKIKSAKLQPPWEKSEISIVGATIAWLRTISGFQYAFIGNSYSPDPMLWAKDGAAGATTVFWNPYSFAFPAIGGPDAHIDLHVGCTSGTFSGFVTIAYTVP